jgi:GNAT superfamily N-acetyltransferase
MADLTPRLARVRFTDPGTQELVRQVQEEYVRRYGQPDGTPLEDGVFEPPSGAFFLAYGEDDEPVAMGGWRMRSDVHPWGRRRPAEVKRMYVAPAARRRGYARVVLSHLEDTARAGGADVMVLETGTAQPEAIALYVAQGYQPVESFGHYAGAPQQRCFGKPL